MSKGQIQDFLIGVRICRGAQISETGGLGVPPEAIE